MLAQSCMQHFMLQSSTTKILDLSNASSAFAWQSHYCTDAVSEAAACNSQTLNTAL